MSRSKHLLFLCTGNSCRSQMADAGVDISGQESTRLTDEMLAWANIVITALITHQPQPIG
jgi:protein-tyrosine-phosphatase